MRGGAVQIRMDGREVKRLVLDLTGAPGRVQRNGRQAVRKTLRLVEKNMKVDARGHKGNWFGKPGTSYDTPLPMHVSSEMTGLMSGEVGIENKGAGKLAHIIVFGSVNNAPVYDHYAAARRAMPQIQQMFADAGEKSVLGEDRD